MTKPSHTNAKDLVLIALSSSGQTGLTAAREQYGWNELATVAPEPLWKKLLAQFSDVVVWILIAAALISGAMGEWTDTAAIVTIVLLNALLGFYQEGKAEKSLAALQSMAAPKAKVVRDEKLASIAARELVPGDLIEIEAGDNVPADLRLLTAFAMRIEEASLTGESVPVEKDAELVLPESTPLADRRNMAHTSTVLANGHGRGVVVAIGMETEIGRIAGMLQTYEREPTPQQRQLAKLGRTLVVICLVLVAVIFLLRLLHGNSWFEAMLASVSLAVAAVPEGLPAVVTTALALGLQRMAKRNALVRKLPSVETLAARSQTLTFWQLGITTNLYVVAAVVVSALLQLGIIALPFTRAIFEATTHTPMEWGLLLALALAPVTLIELVKLGRQFFGRSHQTDSSGASS